MTGVTDQNPSRALVYELLDTTSRFDEPLGVTSSCDHIDLCLIAFGVRARRLLRAACRLLDADEAECANALFRVMSEYLIVGRWLTVTGPDGLTKWALDDLRERRNVLVEMIDDPGLADSAKESLRLEQRATEEAIRRYGGANAPLSKNAARKAGEKSAPKLAQMARDVGMAFSYSFTYRVQSQTDVHATPLAIDAVYEDASPSPADPGMRLRPRPRHAMSEWDLYASGAHLLIDILRPVAERIPELGWTDALEDITTRLQAHIAATS